ncbi:MAG TPA: VOC family protein [Tahibacter sp.]|uniref:VOC family protein n=1 Tax=Tahibacter sp. TaxID=2056211 RepID=UPI002BA83D79|nr:VOC family protein [Tahibacter sp.]HSX61978.1 VOC family protein [Tahibacter sp.]
MARIIVDIDVPDLASGCAFYCAALDLQVARYLFDRSVAELVGANATIYLLEEAAGTIAAAAHRRDYARHWTPVHLDVAVDDLDAALARAVAAGATVEGNIDDASWGRIVRLADPFGHGLCLIQFSAEGYDTVVAG